MTNNGFVRVAAATPHVKIADCGYNTAEAIRMIADAEKQQVAIVTFSELTITAYTVGDLFYQQLLLTEVEKSIATICKAMKGMSIIAIVGLPLLIDNRTYNAAAVLYDGAIIGFVPKMYLPNYGVFFEQRWFAAADELQVDQISYAEQHNIPVGMNLLFATPSVKFGIELCEDLWTALPPSTLLALHGAEIIFNLSASNETAGKHAYRKQLVEQQSGRTFSAYVYASVGATESTTDTVYSGCNLIAENGVLLAQAKRFEFGSQLITADIDVDMLRMGRRSNGSFNTNKFNFDLKEKYKTIGINCPLHQIDKLDRHISKTPFVANAEAGLTTQCEEIFEIQVTGLARRLMHINAKTAVIGVSGGLDSTLALLVLVKAFDKLGLSREGIYGITMPGFGTTNRTYNNAIDLMKLLGVASKEISIVDAVTQHFADIEHDLSVHDITYENAQARERTQILMDYANKVNGLVIGTGDMSELALGWCTYNGDHMSMYGVNSGVPKTLVRILTKWIAENVMDAQSKATLFDIVDTPISPELLPADKEGNIVQKTEDAVGPYILHDFFLYYMLHSGFAPSKIYYLAQHAFGSDYSNAELLKWLRTFYWRFFANQFKRSCMPDGPKVGSVNLSPRGDWRMPSDATVDMWMREIEGLR